MQETIQVFCTETGNGGFANIKNKEVNNEDFSGSGRFMEIKGYPATVNYNSLSYNNVIAKKLWRESGKLIQTKFEVK